MHILLGQADLPAFGGNWKLYAISVGSVVLAMILGRFIQAFRNGAGIIDEAKAVLFGTNTRASSNQTTVVGNQSSTATKTVTTVLMLCLLGGVMFAPMGCASSPQKVVYTTAGTTSVTVAAALAAYEVFVKQGKTTPAQDAQVKAAYGKYQAAFAVLCDAGAVYAAAGSSTNAPVAAAFQQAAVNAAASISDLTNLIQSFGIKF